MAVTIQELETRCAQAKRERDQFKPLLDEAYQYAIPYRKGISETGKAEKRTNRVYDHTAIVSTFRSAARLAQDIWPPGQNNFAMGPAELAKIALDDAGLKEMQAQLEPVTTVVNAHFLSGEWDQALQEMCMDLMAGTGGMLIVPDRAKKIARFVAVPAEELVLASGPYNDVDAIFWERKWPLRAIAAEFGEAALVPELAKQLTEAGKADAEHCLHQDTVYEPKKKRWCRVAWIKDNAPQGSTEPKPLEVSYSRTCPWLTPRYFRVPGETYGRGPIMLVLPTVKALNVATKLNLQAAAIAMLGIYTAIDDGVFNPDNAPVAPGAFWKVARNGGALGPTVQRFPDPRIDLSQVVLRELRMDVQTGMNDQNLPPDTAAVRSATEIMERVKRLASDHQGAYGRLIMEIIIPAVRRVMEIAYDFRQIGREIPIDRLLVDVQVASPMAMAREADRLMRLTQYIEMAMMLSPQNPKRYIKLDVAVPEIAMKMAIPSRFVPSEEERAQMDEDAALEQALAAGMAMAGGEDPAAAAGDAAQPEQAMAA